MAASATDYFSKAYQRLTTTLSADKAIAASSMTLNSATNWPTTTGIKAAVYTLDSNGNINTSTFCVYRGTVSGSSVSNLTLVEGTDQLHSAGAVVSLLFTATHWNDLINGLLVEHTQTGTHTLGSTSTITSSKVVTGLNDTNGNTWFGVTPTASAVNYLRNTNAATTGAPKLSADGTDTNISLNIAAKGTGEVQHNGQQVPPTGSINAYGGIVAPTYWLMCDGSAVSRSTYASLFAILCASIGNPTITIAAPAVVTLSGHNLQTGDQVYLTTTGALPTGLSINTTYYAIRIDANTFNLATSRANAYAATKITTSGTQSGTHTLNWCPYGLGDGTTTFNVPDLRGRVLAGNDYMGGTAASRLNNPSTTSGGAYGNTGSSGGEQAHVQTVSELATHNHTDAGHTHGEQVATGGGAGTGITGTANLIGNTGSNQSTGSGFASINNNGSSVAANVVQPTLVANYIIKI